MCFVVGYTFFFHVIVTFEETDSFDNVLIYIVR